MACSWQLGNDARGRCRIPRLVFCETGHKQVTATAAVGLLQEYDAGPTRKVEKVRNYHGKKLIKCWRVWCYALNDS